MFNKNNFKKTLAIMLIIIAITITLGGCKKENKTSSQDIASSELDNINSLINDFYSDNSSQQLPKTVNGIEMEYTFGDTWKDVFFDYPQLHVIEENTSTVFKNSKYVIAYSTKESTVEDTVITEELLPDFQYATKTHILGKIESLKITSEKEIKIGDYELLQIDGSAVIIHSDESKSESLIHGYTFKYDNAIFELIGISRDGSNEYNEEMTATVDAMIKTLRHKR